MPTPDEYEQYRLLFEHYRLATEDTGRVFDRRERSKDVFIGLNTLLITGVGLLVSQSLQTASWYLPLVLAGIAVVATYINLTWLQQHNSYLGLISLRVAYLQALEERLQSLVDLGEIDTGRYSKRYAAKPTTVGVLKTEQLTFYQTRARIGSSRLDRRLILIFLLAYPTITIFVAVVVYLVQGGLIPAFNLA